VASLPPQPYLARLNAPPDTKPPLAKRHKIAPVLASMACMLVPADASEPAYTTALAVLTTELSNAPCGSGVCKRIRPVAGPRAAQDPPVKVCPATRAAAGSTAQ